MLLRSVFVLLLSIYTISLSAPFLCGETGFVYESLELCNYSCSIECEEMDKNSSSSGSCPSDVKGFFYNPSTRKTYGVTSIISSKDVVYYRRANIKTAPVYMLQPLRNKVRIRANIVDNYDRFSSNKWKWKGFSLSRNWLLLSDGKWYAANVPSGVSKRTNSTFGPLEPDAILPLSNYQIITPVADTCYFDGVNHLEDCASDVVITLPEGLSLIAISDARSVREPVGDTLNDFLIDEKYLVAEERDVPSSYSFPSPNIQGGMRIYWFGEFADNYRNYNDYVTNGYPTGRISFILNDRNWYINEKTPNNTGTRTPNDSGCLKSGLVPLSADNFTIVEPADKCFFGGVNDPDNCGKVVDVVFPSSSLRFKWWTGFRSANVCRKWRLGFSLAVIGLNKIDNSLGSGEVEAKIDNET